MIEVWTCLLVFMFIMYFILDGFDLGAAATQNLVAKTATERRMILRAIGPVWDGNEVWLIAGGGVLYFAFPTLYATGFSGFYLPLMLVLWLLIGRGISMEVRSHLDVPIWRRFWDKVFSFSSWLLIFIFGAAMGNLIRGVHFNEEGWFFLPLWTHFMPYGELGVLDGFTLLTGISCVAMLNYHGLLWVALKCEGAVESRAQTWAGKLWPAALGLNLVAIFTATMVQPHLAERLTKQPLILLPALIAMGLSRWFIKQKRILAAFLSSAGFIASMLLIAAYGLFPYALIAQGGEQGLTFAQAATSSYGMRVGLIWWIPGMILVVGYFVFLYYQFRGKIRMDEPSY